MSISRGLRNNNPLIINQTTPDPWEGLEGNDPDGLLIFNTEIDGLRAGMINLYNGYYLTTPTIRQLSERYLPEDPVYNQVMSDELSRHLDLDEDVVIPQEKWKDVPCVVAYFASGWECDLDKLNQAVDRLPSEEMKDLFRNAKDYKPFAPAVKAVNEQKSFFERYKKFIIYGGVGLMVLILLALLSKKKK